MREIVRRRSCMGVPLYGSNWEGEKKKNTLTLAC
jgi:hypothetical protein